MASLIHLEDVSKAYDTEAGEFVALKQVSLKVEPKEFVAVIGKSGSGKSTLINMITGIDRPTAGTITIAGTKTNGLDENKMAEWRGRNLGIVFQFFQLLPTLTVKENVMLPMDLCHQYKPQERSDRALKLLELVDISSTQANKLPSQLSGGQQQRVAIARALANESPIIVADEPTGNLDSKTAGLIFDLFSRLVSEGKTIIMVTHDRDLAKRVNRTLVIADGEIIEEYLSHTFPGLTDKQLISLTANLKLSTYPAGDVILKKGDEVNKLYIVTKGKVQIVIEPTSGREFVVAEYQRGHYFGEIELMRGGKSMATVRTTLESEVEIAELDKATLIKIMKDAPAVERQLGQVAKDRFAEHLSLSKR